MSRRPLLVAVHLLAFAIEAALVWEDIEGASGGFTGFVLIATIPILMVGTALVILALAGHPLPLVVFDIAFGLLIALRIVNDVDWPPLAAQLALLGTGAALAVQAPQERRSDRSRP
jgi:hypothetical protein